MTARVVERSQLPSARRARAAHQRALAPQLASVASALAARATLPLGAGCTVSVTGIAWDEADRRGPWPTWSLRGTVGRARLAIDPVAAPLLAASLVGLPSPRGPRALSALERGGLVLLVSRLASSVGLDAVVDLEEAGAASALDRDGVSRRQAEVALTLAFVVEGPRVHGLTGHATLVAPPAMLPAAGAAGAVGAVGAAAWSGLWVTMRATIATTVIEAGEVATARAGDVVVFDGVKPWSARPEAPVMVSVGRGVAPAVVVEGTRPPPSDPDRQMVRLRLAGAFAVGDHAPMATRDESTATPVTQALASAPIEVVAELGRTELRGDEVLGLIPGAIVDLGPVSLTSVTLRAGGQPWARGELVDLEGQLGVRVTALLRRPG